MYLLHNIQAEKQENGLWGMPLLCYKSSAMSFIPDDLAVIKSAILIMLAEKYDKPFEIIRSDLHGLMVNLKHLGWIRLNYVNFKLIYNSLYYRTEREAKIEKLLNG